MAVKQSKINDDQLLIITGAAGFIGSSLVRFLNDQGYYQLLLVDDLRRSIKWLNLRNKRFSDFISRDDLFTYLEGKEPLIGAIIHLGACSSTVESDGDYFMKNNYRFSIKLAEYALFYGKRFLYASSAATYGDGSFGFSDEEKSLDHFRPLNLYGFSKQLFDQWLVEEGVLDQVVGLKFFNIFGPNENHKGQMASMVYHMFHQIQREGKVNLYRSSVPELYPDGEQKRDFFYVKEAVKMIYSLLKSDASGLFNVGSGVAHTWNAMARAVFQAMGLKEKIEYIPMPQEMVGKYQNYTCAKMDKFHRLGLDYENAFTFESAIHDYISNHLMKDERW